MTKSQYLSLQDASLLVNKSPQTIRRLIKGNKIRYRKYKTPQGFTYLVEKTNLATWFENHQADFEEETLDGAELVEEFEPIDPPQPSPLPNASPTVKRQPLSSTPHPHEAIPQDTYELGQNGAPFTPEEAQAAAPMFSSGQPSTHHGTSNGFQTIITQLVQQHREDKRRLFELLETFQKRILILEDQIKQLEAPEQKKRRRFFFF